jgi:dTDP-4-dehydrorhamnose 3,5-epimerase
MPVDLHTTPIAGLMLVRRNAREDERGSLTRLFAAEEMASAGWRRPIAHVNQTVTRRRGAVRGLHFQHPPHAEMKLVSCLRGAVWDVAVDLRAGSPTFLRWYAHELSSANRLAMLVPEGFAHGLQTLTDGVELLYLHTAAYVPDAERGIHPREPLLHIDWPLAITEMTTRDQAHPPLPDDYLGLHL